MKIHVQHLTRYEYDLPVYLEPHIFRLRPRSNEAQRLEHFELRIHPTPAGTTECLDQDGTLALNAWFHHPTQELSVDSNFTVKLLRPSPFDYVLQDEALQLPLWYRVPLNEALAPYRQTQRIAETVQQFAQWIASGAQFQTLHFLTELCKQIHQSCRQVVRPSGSPWPAERTLQSREGSCRDLAVLFCDACRVMGIASRFVSGYECESAASQIPYMHAWAEVYLPGIGWRGYDPARGWAVADKHVAVAAGFDSELASPVAGWFSGFSSSRMDVSLQMKASFEP